MLSLSWSSGSSRRSPGAGVPVHSLVERDEAAACVGDVGGDQVEGLELCGDEAALGIVLLAAPLGREAELDGERLGAAHQSHPGVAVLLDGQPVAVRVVRQTKQLWWEFVLTALGLLETEDVQALLLVTYF